MKRIVAEPWLLVDVSALAYRAMYSMGDLSFQGIATGALYGTFRDVLALQELFSTQRVAWCFDRGYGKRLEIDRTYKRKRGERAAEMNDDEREAKEMMTNQIRRLRLELLPELGFTNVFSQKGYEADDVIASICDDLPKGEEAVIISSDSDLYQLLRDDHISIWLPHKNRVFTSRQFRREYGIGVSMWPDVKAIAGCPSDGVVGVPGVGIITAIKFLTGRLGESTKAFQAILACNDLWRKNLKLTRLPFPGVEQFALAEDQVDKQRWEKVMDRLGMKSLRNRRARSAR